MSSEGPISSSDEYWGRWSRLRTTLANRIKSLPVPQGEGDRLAFRQGCLSAPSPRRFIWTLSEERSRGAGGVVSTFFPVQSPKNFLIYLIASPRAIWWPCLDRCALISPLIVYLGGAEGLSPSGEAGWSQLPCHPAWVLCPTSSSLQGARCMVGGRRAPRRDQNSSSWSLGDRGPLVLSSCSWHFSKMGQPLPLQCVSRGLNGITCM